MTDVASQKIGTHTQYEEVIARIADLAGCLEDTPEERELADLFLEIKIWETKKRQMKVVFLAD